MSRTLAYLAALLVLFVGVLLVLPEPTPREPGNATDGALPHTSFAIVGVKAFDGEVFLPEQDIWVQDGRIRHIGRHLDLPADLPRVDGRGRTLLPGLIDAHVHTFGSTLNDALRFGVTTVLDQFTDPRLAASKRAARNSLAPGDEADLFSAGMLATAAEGHGTQYGIEVEPVSGPANAPAWVRARMAEGSDWIKIVREDGSTWGTDTATLARDTIEALIAAAHAEGLLAVMHVSRLNDALEAVALGADGLVHVWRDALIEPAQARGIADANVFVIPTLSVTASISDDSFGRQLSERAGNLPLSFMQRQTLASRFSASSAGTAATGDNIAMQNVHRLHEAGVRLLAGTDVPNPGTAAGFSMHVELQLLHRCGLEVNEVLSAATEAGAAAFGIKDRGRLVAGRIADLVLIDGDLEGNLALSSHIAAVWKDGYPVAPETVAVQGVPGA